ncbi:hypothetical protein [Epilithonimonas xixisoli]|uniref:Uncharacterized protein n=1 Tax=Epilithonimonas xixisoli TaxID=1476462 RepID=A0A4R8I8J7_9FLAO|nr:hypothetical protein [Epilithonimonas xixisoli]TDX85994.1 hypothetical protein B0I22_0089 [Epilithonimonas xixisoli]
MKILRYLKILVFPLVLFLFIGVIYSFWQSRHLSKKFEKTKLNISYNQLVDDWGKPDEEFNINLSYDKRHIIVYNDLLGFRYIFASQEGKTIISEKYIDD